MPTFFRQDLRQAVGIIRMKECTVGTAQLTVNAGQSVVAFDPNYANLDLSGQNIYQRSYLRAGGADYRVGSFNYASGAWVSAQIAMATIASGSVFEVHERISARDLDLCIDEAILQMRIDREVGIPSVDGHTFYTLDGAASPNTIMDIQNVYVFASPDNSLDRVRRDFSQQDIAFTGSGMELRLPNGIGGSQQIVLDALLQLTLAAGEAATINLPARDWVLWGAAAQAYHMLIQKAPGQDAKILEQRRAEAARAYTKLTQRRQPPVDRRISFETPLSGQGRLNPQLAGVLGGYGDNW